MTTKTHCPGLSIFHWGRLPSNWCHSVIQGQVVEEDAASILMPQSKKVTTHPWSTPQAIPLANCNYSLLGKVKVKGCVPKVCWNNLRLKVSQWKKSLVFQSYLLRFCVFFVCFLGGRTNNHQCLEAKRGLRTGACYLYRPTVDGIPTNQLRLVVYPIMLPGFVYPRWLFGISSTVFWWQYHVRSIQPLFPNLNDVWDKQAVRLVGPVISCKWGAKW